MKKLRDCALVVLTICTLLGAGTFAAAEEFRYWTSSNGRRSDVRLKVLSQTEEAVRFQREDSGAVIELPLVRLSDADREYLRSLAAPAAEVAAFAADEAGHAARIAPFLRTHCLRCHGPQEQKAGFRIDEDLPNNFLSRSAVEKWSEVLNMLNTAEMPPEGEPRPPQAEAEAVAEWIETERLRAERSSGGHRPVLRRLNREEYNNTIRDLIGIDLELVEDFPEDPPVAGFDNNGSALTISPFHLELYLKTARKILDRVIVEEAGGPGTIKWHIEFEDGMPGSPRRRLRLDDELNRSIHLECGERPPTNGMVQLHWWAETARVQYFTPPHDGEYIIRVRAAGTIPSEEVVRRAGPEFEIRRQEERESRLASEEERRRSRENFERFSLPTIQQHFEESRSYRYGPPRLRLLGYLGSRRPVLDEFDVTAPLAEPRIYESRVLLTAEKSSLMFSNDYRIPGHWFLGMNYQKDDFPAPDLYLDWVEIEGPVYDAWPPSSHTRIFFDSPHKGRDETAYAREVLARFMARAFRRPLAEGEVDPFLALFREVRSAKPSFEEAMKIPLSAVLTSPHFLYLVEEETPGPLTQFELAARLSYFLWSSLPDEELLALAEQGGLNDPRALTAQVDRMLADPRGASFIRNFAGQWLGLRKLGVNPPDRELYPRYDDHLENSMRRESEEFFAHILKEDRSVLEFLQSDYVVINERLARFYDIPGVKGDHFRPVPVPAGTPRGGLVTQASILSITSNGTRTSPVWRGAWLLENLLGDPPPPPPPNAGDIPAVVAGREKVTVRERLELHREQPQCARCHNKIDPLGFALENFAASGEWREREAKAYMFPATNTNDPPIDAAARLPDGAEFTGVDGLRAALLERREQFLRCLAQKLYTYALGRELRHQDEPLLESAVATLEANDFKLRALLHEIVTSTAFREK